MSPGQPVRGHSPSARPRTALDLSVPEVFESVGADQIAYYKTRAPWYDDVYECIGEYDRGPELNAEWQADLAEVELALGAAPVHGDCVELGSGTGYWSERFVQRVDGLWSLESAPETQVVALERLGTAASKVRFESVDLWRWQPARAWDCAVACFFLEHVPDEVLPGLLATLHDALRPGAAFFVAEAAAQQFAPALEKRSIDGRSFGVVERRRTLQEFETSLDLAGFSIRDSAENRVVHLTAIRD